MYQVQRKKKKASLKGPGYPVWRDIYMGAQYGTLEAAKELLRTMRIHHPNEEYRLVQVLTDDPNS